MQTEDVPEGKMAIHRNVILAKLCTLTETKFVMGGFCCLGNFSCVCRFFYL